MGFATAYKSRGVTSSGKSGAAHHAGGAGGVKKPGAANIAPKTKVAAPEVRDLGTVKITSFWTDPLLENLARFDGPRSAGFEVVSPGRQISIKFGAGVLTTHAAAPGNLLDGIFEGGVRQRSSGPNQVEIEQDTTYGLPWLDHGANWDVGLTAEVSLDLRLETGANRSMLDLRDLRLRSLALKTGASETRVLLPRAAGVTTVGAESGVASLTLEVPAGVAARIRGRMALGTSQVDQALFPRVGDGYESPDYANATNRIDIDISGGVGSVRVIGGGA